MRVLIADDNDLLANLWSVALRAESIEVMRARDGEEAVELCRRLNPDVVLMDIMMPRLDGLEAFRTIRRSMTRPPRVIFVSCVARSVELEEAKSMRAADFMVKGRFTLHQLVAGVKRAVRDLEGDLFARAAIA
ncbi:MAG: response regulator [Armatimonadetes bacterium]|nr:response regulator [Armatimonadota bacterium]